MTSVLGHGTLRINKHARPARQDQEEGRKGTCKVMQGRDDQSSAADVPDDARDLDDARDDNVVHDLQGEFYLYPATSSFRSCHHFRMAMPITVPSCLHRPMLGGWLWMVSVVRSLYTLAVRPVAAGKL